MICVHAAMMASALMAAARTAAARQPRLAMAMGLAGWRGGRYADTAVAMMLGMPAVMGLMARRPDGAGADA